MITDRLRGAEPQRCRMRKGERVFFGCGHLSAYHLDGDLLALKLT